MKTRRLFQWLSLVFLVHTAILAYFFSDKIIAFKFNSSASLSISNQNAGYEDQHLIIKEIEKAWQEKLIEDLFKEDFAAEINPNSQTELIPTAPETPVFESEMENSRPTESKLDQPEEKINTNPVRNSQSSGNLQSLTISRAQHELGDNKENKELELATQRHNRSDHLDEYKNQDGRHEPVSNYMQSEDKYQQKTDPPVESRPKMVLVMTQSRHGSTWLMDMLGYREDAVPVFEPLNSPKFLKIESIYPKFREEAAELGLTKEAFPDWREIYLARICLCDWYGTKINAPWDERYEAIRGIRFKDMHGKAPKDPNQRHSTFFTKHCTKEGSMMVPKTIRYYNLTNLHKIIDFGCGSFKVIHLVRDPRAVLNSRMITFYELFDGNHLLGEHIDNSLGQGGFDESYMKRAAEHLCSHHLENYKLGMNPPTWLKDRYKLVRYEDLALYPDYWTQDLLDFIGVEYTPEYRQYVYNITHVNDIGKKNNGNFGVERQSSDMLDLWKKKLKENHWRTIEKVCAEMMRVFNYKATFLIENR